MVAEGDIEDSRMISPKIMQGKSRQRHSALECLKEIAKVVDKDDAVRIAIGTDCPSESQLNQSSP